MSLVSISIPEPFVNDLMMGSKAYEAKSGASSVFVQVIFAVMVNPFVSWMAFFILSNLGLFLSDYSLDTF